MSLIVVHVMYVQYVNSFHLYCKSRYLWRNLHRWQKIYTAPAVTTGTKLTSVTSSAENRRGWLAIVKLKPLSILISLFEQNCQMLSQAVIIEK